MRIIQSSVSRHETFNSHLHIIPFFFIWLASYGVAWLSLHINLYLVSVLNAVDIFMYVTAFLVTGFIFGACVSFIQAWLLKQRYNYVPKFWYPAIIGTSVLSFLPFFDLETIDLFIFFVERGFIAFTLINIVQAILIYRVNHWSWLIAMFGIVPTFIILTGYDLWIDAYWLALYFSFIVQMIVTTMMILLLFSNLQDIPLEIEEHRFTSLATFVFMWVASYFVGLLVLIVLVAIFFTFHRVSIVENVYIWLSYQPQWLGYVSAIGFVGSVSSWMQRYIMQQYAHQRLHFWSVFSSMGWFIAGYGFYFYTLRLFPNNPQVIREVQMSAFVWFAVPSLFQTIPIWLAFKKGWLWSVTGIAIMLIILPIMINLKFVDWNTKALLMIGGLMLYSLMAGICFAFLNKQRQLGLISG